MNRDEYYNADTDSFATDDSFATAGSFSQDQVFFLTRKVAQHEVAINEEIEKRKSEISQLRQTMSERFAARDDRFDTLEQRENLTEEIQTQVAALQARIKEIDSQVEKVDTINNRSLRSEKLLELALKKITSLEAQIQKNKDEQSDNLKKAKTSLESEIKNVEKIFEEKENARQERARQEAEQQKAEAQRQANAQNPVVKMQEAIEAINRAMNGGSFQELRQSAKNLLGLYRRNEVPDAQRKIAEYTYVNARNYSTRKFKKSI